MIDLISPPEIPRGYRRWIPRRERTYRDFPILDHVWEGMDLYERLMTDRMDCEAASRKKGTPVVYFIQGRRYGPVKIGTADGARVKNRLSELQTGNPERLSIIRTVRGGRALEQEIHDLLAIYRLAGEWFAPDARVLALVGQLPNSMERDNEAFDYQRGYWHGREAGRTRYFMAGKAAGFREAQARTLRALGFSERGEVTLTYSQMEPPVKVVGP